MLKHKSSISFNVLMNIEVNDSTFISSIFTHFHKLLCQALFNFMKLKEFNNYKKNNIIHLITLFLIILEKKEKITELYIINQQT